MSPIEEVAGDKFGGEPHHFEITVRSWLDGANWSSLTAKQTIRAYSLPQALKLAAALPLQHWLPADEERPS